MDSNIFSNTFSNTLKQLSKISKLKLLNSFVIFKSKEKNKNVNF